MPLEFRLKLVQTSLGVWEFGQEDKRHVAVASDPAWAKHI